MRRMSCPICRRPVAERSENAAYPFCSERCRLVDLGRWLGEDYRIPGGPSADAVAAVLGAPRDDD